MASEEQDSLDSLILTVIFGLIVLVLGVVISVSIYQSRRLGSVSQVARPVIGVPWATHAPSTDSDSTAQTDSDAATIQVDNGIVKFYFASGNADLGSGAGDALAGVIKGISSGRRIVISGFHDPTGDPAKNIALANLRALTVREAILVAGVSEQKIELGKPQQMALSGTNAEARRVEVSLK